MSYSTKPRERFADHSLPFQANGRPICPATQAWENCDVGPGLYLERGITNNLASGTRKSGERELAARFRTRVYFPHENERLISGSSNESGMATN